MERGTGIQNEEEESEDGAHTDAYDGHVEVQEEHIQAFEFSIIMKEAPLEKMYSMLNFVVRHLLQSSHLDLPKVYTTRWTRRVRHFNPLSLAKIALSNFLTVLPKSTSMASHRTQLRFQQSFQMRQRITL